MLSYILYKCLFFLFHVIICHKYSLVLQFCWAMVCSSCDGSQHCFFFRFSHLRVLPLYLSPSLVDLTARVDSLYLVIVDSVSRYFFTASVCTLRRRGRWLTLLPALAIRRRLWWRAGRYPCLYSYSSRPPVSKCAIRQCGASVISSVRHEMGERFCFRHRPNLFSTDFYAVMLSATAFHIRYILCVNCSPLGLNLQAENRSGKCILFYFHVIIHLKSSFNTFSLCFTLYMFTYLLFVSITLTLLVM